MRANPGGSIDPSEILGRDGLVQRIWRVLERQSLILTAERRMGKTCVITKMMQETPPNVLCICQEVEGIRSPHDFVDGVFERVERHLDTRKRTAGRVKRFVAQLGGTEFAGVKLPDIAAPHWRAILSRLVDDLLEDQDRSVVFFWDELPLMLHDVKEDHGEPAAMQLLDALRSLRQTHRELRMVYTGSIGLHHVITGLRSAGYANDPTNDMGIVDVPPLARADAEDLARRLLEGEGIQTPDAQATASAIAEAVDGVPYFIHHVVDRIALGSLRADPRAVARVVADAMTDPQDSWHLRHYRERIDTYYTSDERPCALYLLDILAAARRPMQFPRLFDLLKTHHATEDEEMARHVLTLLQRDHYVVQHEAGGYAFRFPLIARSWCMQRGVTR